MAVYRPKYTDPKTGRVKQQAVWWYEFIFAGERVRQSAKTTKKTIAIETEKDHRRRLERANAGMPTEQPEQRIRTVASVLKDYEADYAVNHAERSGRLVKDRARHAARLLGGLLLPDVTQARLVDYMKKRREEGVGNRTINIELMILSRAMGSTWKTLWPKLKKLKENSDVGIALEDEQAQLVLEAAARNPSRLIYPFLMTLRWTGFRSDEARRLRWSQVDFEAGEVIVGQSKTEAGKGRGTPMSQALKAALQHHASYIAQTFGPIQPGWYVFPSCRSKRPIDPKRPVGSLKKAWKTVRQAAGVRCRLHDLRHSFCTELGESGVPESVMLDLMGHMSTAMLRKYSHIRAKARREAIEALESGTLFGAPKEIPKVSDLTAKGKIVN